MSQPTVGLGPVRETLLITRYELAEMLLGVRTIFFAVVYLGVNWTIGAAYLWFVDKMRDLIAAQSGEQAAAAVAALDDDQLREALVTKIEPVLQFLGGDALVASVSQGDLPLMLLVMLLLSTFVLPGLILIVGHDRIAGDLGSKYARFVLQRVRRGTWLAGKILGHWGAALITVIVVHVALLGFAAADGRVDVASMARVLPKIWLAMAFFTLAYSALCGLLSSLVTRPFLVITMGAGLLMFMWFFSFSSLGRSLWMGNWDVRLWVLEPKAIGVFVANVAVFYGLALLRLRTRDI